MPSVEHRGASLDRTRDSSYNAKSNTLKKTARTSSSGYSGGQSSYGANQDTNAPSLHTVDGRRSHSYEQNLERQILAENPMLDYSPNLNMNPVDLAERIQFQNQALQNPLAFQMDDPFGNTQNMLMFGQNFDVTSLQKDCAKLTQELEISREKLNACLTSVRTFWSPELKRERSLRKEENAKYAILVDHMHQIQLDKQTMLQSMHSMEAELHRLKVTQRDFTSLESLHSELEITKKRVNELTRENRQLLKEIEESERRSSYLKTNLGATEQSLRNLVDAVRTGKSESGGLAARLDRIDADIAEIERLRNQVSEANQRAANCERTLIDRECEITKMKEDTCGIQLEIQNLKEENSNLRHEKRQIQTLQALVDTKESKILTLENEIHLLEDEISRMRDEGIVTPTTSISSGIEDVDKTIQQFRSNERILKSKIELLNGEISKRDSEIFALQSRLEMLDKQHQDQAHHIDVLKEQVKTREQKVNTVSTDLDELKRRLREKDSSLEKKTKSLNSAQAVKRQIELQLSELKEQLDIRERKISLLLRKVENLDETLSDKEAEITTLKSRIASQGSYEAPHIQVQSGMISSSLEETFKEHERQIQRLKESKERSEHEFHNELETQRKQIQELRGRLDSSQRELEDKSCQLSEARDELTQLRNVKLDRETENSQLQGQLSQKQSEISALQVEKQLLHKQMYNESELKFQQRIGDLESQVNHYMESASKLQSEVDRLLGLVRNLDSEKMDKDNHIQEVEEQLHEAQNTVNSVKRANQMERQKLTQMLNEARMKSESLERELEQNRSQLEEKVSRVHELEQALRESVRLTAERDMLVSGRDETTRILDQQLRDLRLQVEQLQRERNSLSGQLQTAQDELRDKEAQLKVIESECVSVFPFPPLSVSKIQFQSYLPELEKLRKSNYELNLRVSALLKLIQGREYQLTEEDKHVLSSISMYTSLGPGNISGAGYLGLQLPGTMSPHLSGSAFQLIGSAAAQQNKAYSTGMRSPLIGGPPVTSAMAQRLASYASGPGNPIMAINALGSQPNPIGLLSPSYPDSSVLLRMLSEKENTLQQNLMELTKLRVQNAELDSQLKSLQLDLDNKNQRLRSLGPSTSLYSPAVGGMVGDHTELLRLRQQTQDLMLKLDQAKRMLCEREERLRLMEATQSNDLAFELDKLRKEIDHLRIESAGAVSVMPSNEQCIILLPTQCSLHEREIERLRAQNVDLNNNCMQLETSVKEKEAANQSLNKTKTQIESDYDSLQKKYKSVLAQLTEHSDKIKQLENNCYHEQLAEIKRLRQENEEYERKVTHIQRSLADRESRCDQIEKEITKQRDDSCSLRRQLHASEVEIKSLKEESIYREERIRQMQSQHSEEMNRLRTTSQEQASKASHWKLLLEDKEHDATLAQNEL
ncbi:ethionine resistance protein, partial [Cichlidogyrus casuarinus]